MTPNNQDFNTRIFPIKIVRLWNKLVAKIKSISHILMFSGDLPANTCLPPITQLKLYSYAGYSKLVNLIWSDVVEKAVEKYSVLVFIPLWIRAIWVRWDKRSRQFRPELYGGSFLFSLAWNHHLHCLPTLSFKLKKQSDTGIFWHCHVVLIVLVFWTKNCASFPEYNS